MILASLPYIRGQELIHKGKCTFTNFILSANDTHEARNTIMKCRSLDQSIKNTYIFQQEQVCKYNLLKLQKDTHRLATQFSRNIFLCETCPFLHLHSWLHTLRYIIFWGTVVSIIPSSPMSAEPFGSSYHNIILPPAQHHSNTAAQGEGFKR
jgi:hypothetical protein